MSNSNTGYLFHKRYFDGFSWPPNQKDQKLFFDGEVNPRILDRKFRQSDRIPSPGANFTIPLWTTYPGLIIGSGYSHGTGYEGEFKIGFHFDYTSGMPVLPGSSVKGILRSAFPDWKKDKTTPIEIKKNKARLIWFLITGKQIEALTEEESAAISELEEQIFEGKRQGERMSIYGCDTFFDAVVLDGFVSEQGGGFIFGKDFITPHKHPTKPELDQFANPVPLMFLKVLPYVPWEFRFSLHDSEVPLLGRVGASLKLAIFEKILLMLGIGAKTNVGYGQLIDKATFQALFPSSTAGEDRRNPPPDRNKEMRAEKPSNFVPPDFVSKMLKGKSFEGILERQVAGYNVFTFDAGKSKASLVKKIGQNPDLQIGQRVNILLGGPYELDNTQFKVTPA